MLAFINILICLAFGLANLISARKDYAKEAYKYHGIALVESWIGCPAINIGDLTSQNLYDTLHKGMDKSCPYTDSGECDFSNVIHGVLKTSYIEQFPGTKSLYKPIALIAAELTTTDENCYWLIGHRMCNLGERITINMPAIDGKANHLCCPTLKVVNGVLDGSADEMKGIFKKDFSRHVKCLIWGWVDCDECGCKCNSCGAECEDVCPGGKC